MTQRTVQLVLPQALLIRAEAFPSVSFKWCTLRSTAYCDLAYGYLPTNGHNSNPNFHGHEGEGEIKQINGIQRKKNVGTWPMG